MTGNDMAAALGIVFVALGLLNILARDFFWKIEKLKQAIAGKRVERTELWDFWRILGGLILIGFGIMLMTR